MVTNSFNKSDLNEIYNIVQNNMISYPKEAIITTLREFFKQDSYYRYLQDQWGFPYIPDETGMPLEAGMLDNLTTRLFIGESFKQDLVFYPALIVKGGGSSYTPLSFNREYATVSYNLVPVYDGYGNYVTFNIPKNYILAGIWEGSVSIDIRSRSMTARDELVELVSILCSDIAHDKLINSGIVVKRVSASGPSEQEDRNNKLYTQQVNLEIYSEWRREIPITNLIEIISFAIDIGRTDVKDYPVSPNLRIKIIEDIINIIDTES